MSTKVLVVEDDRHINEVVVEYLKDSGYIVRSAQDGKEALCMLSQFRDIGLFVLDIMLPELNGLELLDIIRKHEAYKEKPVVMLTALGDEATQLLSFEALADDYIVKPFSPKVLVKRVEALLRRSGEKQSTLDCGGIRLDYETFEVYDRGERIYLTLREFELMGTMLRNAGKVLNRQQLLNHAWGYEYFGDERIVDVHIKNIRKKLRSNVITTIKGVGYKLEET